MRQLGWFLIGVCAALGTPSLAQEVYRGEGPVAQVALSPTIILNEGTSLRHRWSVVVDRALPVKIDLYGYSGVNVSYGRDYQYKADFTVTVTEPILALEVKFVTFDVWNERTKTLLISEVTDIPVGQHKMHGSWSIFQEADASEHYQSLAFVNRVRLASGKVVQADLAPVLDEIARITGEDADETAVYEEDD